MLVNMTPHPINIYTQDQVDQSNPRRLFLKDPDSQPRLIIPPSGNILNVDLQYDVVNNIDGVPVFSQFVLDIQDPFDDYTSDAFFIVSALYKAKFKDHYLDSSLADRLLTVGQVIYNSPDNPRPIGCLGLSK